MNRHTEYDSTKKALQKTFEYDNVKWWFEDSKKENTLNGYIKFFKDFLELFNENCVEWGFYFVGYRYGELELKVLEEAAYRVCKDSYKIGLALYICTNEAYLFNRYSGRYEFEFPPIKSVTDNSDLIKFYKKAFKKHKLLLAHI